MTENISEMVVADEVKKLTVDFIVNQLGVVERGVKNINYEGGQMVENDIIGMNNAEQELKYVMLQTP